MLAVMNRCREISGVRALASGVAVLALVVGCTGEDGPQATGTPTVTTPPAPSSTVETTTAAATPTYTSPPSRGLTRPAGLGPVPGSACDPAATDAHFFEVAWYTGYAGKVEAGEPVPDFRWAEGPRVLPSFRRGVATSRTRLVNAGVPAGFAVFGDLADLDAAMREGVDVARAKDDSRVLPVYFRAKAARDHLIESCGVLEG
jgi:hypothetical protein